MGKNWFQRKENQPALITSTGAIIAAIIAGLFLWGNGCFSKTLPPAPTNTNTIKADGQATVNVSNRNDDHSQHINNFYISGTAYVFGSLVVVVLLFFAVRSRSQSKTEKFESPKESHAPRESAPNEIRTQSLTDCFSKLVGVTQAFENYVCYMPDEKERAKNRDDYAAKMRGYENHLKTNLFVPPSLKADITKFLDEITRQVSHYIVSVETGTRPMGYKEHAAFVKISDFARDGCQVWLKKIEREFHHLLHPSGNAQDTINTIKTLYPKIKATKDAYDQFRQMMEPESRKDDFEKLDKHFKDAWNYFSDNRLYLGETTSDCVYQLLTHINASTIQFKMALTESQQEPRDEDTRGHLFDMHYKTDYNITILYAEMEKNFKQVLGVT
jgi:hypothetical protein